MPDSRFKPFRYREDAWAVWDAAADAVAWFVGRELQCLSKSEAEAAAFVFNKAFRPSSSSSNYQDTCPLCGQPQRQR